MPQSTSKVALCVSITSLIYIGIVFIYVGLHYRYTHKAQLVNKRLADYRHFLFIAHVNVFFQLISLFSHVAGHFSSSHRKSRDFVFTNFAFPLSISTMGSTVMFWYLIQKAEVFSEDTDILWPLWLKLGSHIMSPIVNLVLLYSIRYKYSNNPYMFSYSFMAAYSLGTFLLYIKDGDFRHVMVRQFTNLENASYYFGLSLFSHFCYLCGYVYNDMYNSMQEYEKIIAAKIAEAEREINLAPSPFSRTPTPLNLDKLSPSFK